MFVRRHNVDEVLVVIAVESNIVIKNRWGYFHTISFSGYDSAYERIPPEEIRAKHEALRK